MTSLIKKRRSATAVIGVALVSLFVCRQPHAEELADLDDYEFHSRLTSQPSAGEGVPLSIETPSTGSLRSNDTAVAKDVTAFRAEAEVPSDRFWLISTRTISSSACRINLDSPDLSVFQIDCGCPTRTTLDQYFASLGPDRTAVVYVHGNRMQSQEAIGRGFAVYRNISRYRDSRPVDWVIWSWPSAKQGILIHDARRKAARTDAQGLYLAWLLRKHVEQGIPTTLIGFSFGGRVITGSLHALAGGKLGGREMPGSPVSGVPFDAGLVAPAIDSHWLGKNGYHSLATQNLDRLVLLYNRRDVVLKRYWLLDRVRGRMALGYSGPRVFSPRADGSKLSVLSRDCSPSIGLQHDELDYYRKSCHAGSFMARLIDDIDVTH